MKKIATILLFFPLISFSQNALNFDGVDDVVQTSFTPVSGNNARTVEAWIKTSANCNPNSGGTQNVILDWGSFTNGNRSTFNLLWNNSIRFEVGGSGLSGSIPVNDGNWHHVAFVYDPTAPDPIKLFIDGSLDVSGTIPTPVNTVANTPLRIGNRIDNAKPFSGEIDEVRIWNVARADSQIANYKDREFCVTEPGLVAYYRLNDGVAGGNNTGLTTAMDDMGSNNGSLLGFSLNGIGSNWVTGASLDGNKAGNVIDSTCGVYTDPNGGTYDSTGIYQYVLPAINGCDSIVTLDLTVNTVNTTVVLDNNNITMYGTTAGTSYQWIDCSDNSPISGANQSSFTPTANGDYAMVIEQNGCVDTSDCISIVSIGLSEYINGAISVYPNPAKEVINIEIPHELLGVTNSIYTLSGALVSKIELNNSVNPINISSWPKGVYIIHSDQSEVKPIRFVKW